MRHFYDPRDILLDYERKNIPCNKYMEVSFNINMILYFQISDVDGLINANEINSSEYYTYTPKQDRGLYFEHLGLTRIIEAEYKLVTYFS